MEEKLFRELFCIKNDFPKYLQFIVFKYFVPHITTILRNDILQYHRTNQISFKIHMLSSLMTYFSGVRVYEIVNNCLSLQFVI